MRYAPGELVVRPQKPLGPDFAREGAKVTPELLGRLRTADTADRRAYDIAWVQDKASPVDTINYFTEVYMDARGIKGSWEALVFYVNRHKTEGIQKLAREAPCTCRIARRRPVRSHARRPSPGPRAAGGTLRPRAR